MKKRKPSEGRKVCLFSSLRSPLRSSLCFLSNSSQDESISWILVVKTNMDVWLGSIVSLVNFCSCTKHSYILLNQLQMFQAQVQLWQPVMTSHLRINCMGLYDCVWVLLLFFRWVLFLFLSCRNFLPLTGFIFPLSMTHRFLLPHCNGLSSFFASHCNPFA